MVFPLALLVIDTSILVTISTFCVTIAIFCLARRFLDTSVTCLRGILTASQSCIRHTQTFLRFLRRDLRNIAPHRKSSLTSSVFGTRQGLRYVGTCVHALSAMTSQYLQRTNKEDSQVVLSLRLESEYHIPIPTTHIEAILNTSTLQRAYCRLTTSSVQFRRLTLLERCTVIQRIAEEIIVYDGSTEHVWCMKELFTKAAAVLQYQIGVDWFERLIVLPTMRTNCFSGDDEHDTMADFIAIVFVIICGFPLSYRRTVSAADQSTEGSATINDQPGLNLITDATDSSLHPSSTTDNDSQPGSSQQ